MPTINRERLLDDLNRLRDFGRHGNGVVRPSLSDQDIASRRWLAERFTEAGLDASIDGVANVFGRSPRPGKALLVGSHSDTQPTGGWLDGALGVIYGLEVARAMAEDTQTADLPVDVVSWVDEEGTFLGCLGSRAWCGQLAPDDLTDITDAKGQRLTDALAAHGLGGIGAVGGFEAERQFGYLEAHIEQGPYLEQSGEHIGVVTSIVGIRAGQVTFVGQQNHAGTTPMDRRRDAGVAMFEYATQIRTRFQGIAGSRTVWTIGDVAVFPGAPSIVPGRANLLLQFRDPDSERLESLERAAHEVAEAVAASTGVATTYERSRSPVAPTIMDDAMREHLARAAERHAPGNWREMPSAAGHDPMVLADTLPCAMLFIPSIGGISHDFAEDSSDDDIARGCQVMADAVASLTREANR